MSLFLQTLVFRGICCVGRSIAKNKSVWGPAEARRQAVLKTASRFAGAGELRNAALRPAFGVTSSTIRLVTERSST